MDSSRPSAVYNNFTGHTFALDFAVVKPIWQIFGASKCIKPSGSLGCCPLLGGGSVVVDLLFNVFLIVCGCCVCLCYGMHHFVSFLVLQSF